MDVIFLFQDLFQDVRLHLVDVFPQSPLVCDSFFVFHDLTVLGRVGQVSCRISPNLSLSNVFLIIRMSLWVWGKNITQVKCPHHMLSRDL